MRQMTSEDAVWLYSEPPGESMHVTQATLYEPGDRGTLSRNELEAILETRVLPRVSVFRQRLRQVPLKLDFPYWVEDADFDLSHHVKTRSVAAPGDWRALLETFVAIHAEPLDTRRPLWDMTLVTGLERVFGVPEGSFAVASRFHHAMADGQSVMEITRLMHDTSPDCRDSAAKRSLIPSGGEAPSPVRIAFRAAEHAVTQPFDTLTGLARSVPGLGLNLLRRRSLPKLPKGPRCDSTYPWVGAGPFRHQLPAHGRNHRHRRRRGDA
jgi:diacylglycerol O-acyltransferase / wax synthase